MMPSWQSRGTFGWQSMVRFKTNASATNWFSLNMVQNPIDQCAEQSMHFHEFFILRVLKYFSNTTAVKYSYRK